MAANRASAACLGRPGSTGAAAAARATASRAAPPREENPGLINEIGKLFDKLPPLKSPQRDHRRPECARERCGKGCVREPVAAGQAGLDGVGAHGCPVSANGAPDCKAGADKLCQSKGYKEGKSLNTDSAETCSAKVLIPGRTRKPDDCRTDNYVTSALCQ